MPFIWVIRTWCSLDSFWEAVRSGKGFDVAYSKPEQVIEAIERIILEENQETTESREFLVELPTVDQIKTRPFLKFLSVTDSNGGKEPFVQNWYIERLRKAD
jgi:hypothetical protein